MDRLYSSYPDVISAYAEIIKGFSTDEQSARFSGNAERMNELPVVGLVRALAEKYPCK